MADCTQTTIARAHQGQTNEASSWQLGHATSDEPNNNSQTELGEGVIDNGDRPNEHDSSPLTAC
jgi:hypothetical protein